MLQVSPGRMFELKNRGKEGGGREREGGGREGEGGRGGGRREGERGREERGREREEGGGERGRREGERLGGGEGKSIQYGVHTHTGLDAIHLHSSTQEQSR